MNSHRDAEDGAHDPRKPIALLGTTAMNSRARLVSTKMLPAAWDRMTFSAASPR